MSAAPPTPSATLPVTTRSGRRLAPEKLPSAGCLTLIGMAGVGKSTVGRLLAQELGWAHLDTDRLLEAYYGLPLQDIFDNLGRQAFLQAEEAVVAGLNMRRCVISTGGSVIYGPTAMERLRRLGPVIHLQACLQTIECRIDNLDQRGLAKAPGQGLDALLAEREPLYLRAACWSLPTDQLSPEQSSACILDWLETAP